MSEQQLITVASYTEVYQADIAKSALEDDGIIVKISGREIASMMAGSVGGTQLLVRESDAERACEILSNLNSDPIDEDELARQALAEQAEEDRVDPAGEAVFFSDEESGSTEERAARIREDYASRFLRASFIAIIASLFCGLFWYYAIYLGLRATLSSGELTPEGRKRIVYGWIAIIGNMMFWMWLAVLVRSYFRSD